MFISDEAGGVETVIDTQRNERVNTIEMGGEVGNTQYDPVSHLIYACVQTRNELVEINPETDKIQARYHLPGGEHPHGSTSMIKTERLTLRVKAITNSSYST